MNPWWLVLIVPASATLGAFVMALCVTAKREDEDMEGWDEDE